MANIRCPMCSKFNPPDAEVCSYCGARLKPLRPPSGGLPASPPTPVPSQLKPEAPTPAVPSGEEPDWLRQLRADEPPHRGGPAETPSTPTGPLDTDSDVPDWLSRIRERNQSDAPETSTGGGQESGSDWLKGLQGEANSDQNLDDWLDRLPGAPPPTPPASQPPASSTPQAPFPKESFAENDLPGSEAAAPDWLRSFAEETSADHDESAGPPAGSSGSATKSAEPAPEPPAFGQEDDFSWLDRFKSEEAQPPTQQEQESSSGFGLTGFLSGQEQPAAPSPEESSPQWSGPEEQPGQETPSSGFGLTGFLSNLENTDASQDESTPGEKAAKEPFTGWDQGAEAASSGEVPDWLRGMESDLPQQPAGQEPGGKSDFNAGEFDWLHSLSGEAPTEPPAETPAKPFVGPAEEPMVSEGELPDWLAGFTAPQQPSDQPQAEQPSAGQGTSEQPKIEELPDWLNGAFLTQTGTSEGEEAPETPGETSPTAREDLPDWFAGPAQADLEKPLPSPTGETQPTTPEPEQSGQEAEPAGENEQPDWLREFQAQAPGETNELMAPLSSEEIVETPSLEGDQPFTVGLPEWLSEEETAKPAQAQEQPIEMGGEELAHADLPDWVKEMRPIESIIPGETQTVESDQHIEKAGPLAGMRGVLPAEEPAGYYRKPAVYSSKLRVTEKQRNQASLLESIIAEETHPLLIPPKAAHTQGLLLRVLMALLLVGALVIPFLPMTKLDPLALPVLYPADMLNMFDAIDKNLQSNAPVLLAVDYEPGLSGEMRLASSAVVEHLMAKNARIVMISTVPAGPALGLQLLQDASATYKARTQKDYNVAAQTLNLGYLPGGTISLLEFAKQPRQAAPATLNGANAWSDTFLQAVPGIGGFSQVVVLTDRAETGRSWVEQVQPQLDKVPMFMVTSAQAAPLMAPYVESGQVSGTASGLLGGAMYERLSGQENSPALQSLAAYQIGVVLAIVLVLVGGVVSLGRSLLKRNEGEEE